MAAEGTIDYSDELKNNKKKFKGTFLWYIIVLLCVLGAVLCAASIFMGKWRATNDVRYHFILKDTEKELRVAPASFGLYTMGYDEGKLSQNFGVVEEQTCKSAEEITYRMGNKNANSQNYILSLQCDQNCHAAIIERCNLYRRLAFIGRVVLGVIALSIASSLLGIVWMFLIARSIILLMCFWGISGIAICGAVGYWMWETDTLFRKQNTLEQYPYPSIGTAFYITVIGAGMMLAAGGGAYIASRIDAFTEEREKRMKLQEQRQKEQYDSMLPHLAPPPDMPLPMRPGGGSVTLGRPQIGGLQPSPRIQEAAMGGLQPPPRIPGAPMGGLQPPPKIPGAPMARPPLMGQPPVMGRTLMMDGPPFMGGPPPIVDRPPMAPPGSSSSKDDMLSSSSNGRQGRNGV